MINFMQKRDLDTLQDDSIELFIQKINCLQGIQITRIGDIEELKQQDYHGKRVHIKISDEYGNSIISKIDLGVHKNLSIEQEEYCFDICYAEDGASLLVNTKEQMFTEKLKSFLKFGTFSTRYKDIFDMYYLTDFLDKANLNKCFSQYIFRDSKMKEKNVQDVCRRISVIFKNGSYVQKLLSTDTNWLEMDVTIVIKKIQCFLEELVCIEKEEKVV